MPPPPGISIAPLRTYLTKLPFLTILISGLCVLLWLVEVVTWLPVGESLRLDPRAMGLSQCKLKSWSGWERGFMRVVVMEWMWMGGFLELEMGLEGEFSNSCAWRE